MEKQSPAENFSRGRRFGAPRLLIVGCGDVGLRIVARLRHRFRIVAMTSTPARRDELRHAGTTPIVADLDERRALARVAPFAGRMIHLAPPPNRGRRDPRTRHLVAAARGRLQRFVYISTTGVYGDRAGAWTDETAPLAPQNERAMRRVDAEHAVRAVGACVLRVPGIYAQDRLPIERLRAGTPALAEVDDVFTNHIHADDLARIAIAALFRGRASRVYNAVDDSELKMGEYFDLVADRFGLPRAARLPREQLKTAVSPMMYSFMNESRRLRNRRIKRELKLRLRWPTVATALAASDASAR
ncbi:MAG: NAD(P)H-binding protein [Gemmatimonadota bacterium]